SHSLLNFRTVHDVLEAYEPMALRLYLLQTHYRAPLTFREDALAGAAQGLARLRGAVEALPGEGRPPQPEGGRPPQPPNNGGSPGAVAPAENRVGAESGVAA